MTQLPLISLYGPRLGADPSMLVDLDLVVVDLQDIGTRFYTFLWTLSSVMEACGEADVPLLVLDRPNPIGGDGSAVEGPIQESVETSGFLGRWPIPIRHSLTLGEMARLLREEMELEVLLDVVQVTHWNRSQLWHETGLHFYPPSPGIPSYESALLYPGLAFLEATNLSEGRGSGRAFRWLGAPWVDPDILALEIDRLALPGLEAVPDPLPGLANREEGPDPWPGVRLKVVEPQRIRPVRSGLRLLALLRTLWPSEFQWTSYPTYANPSGRGHLLSLLGRRDIVRVLQEEPETVDEETVTRWTDPGDWRERVGPHLLYD